MPDGRQQFQKPLTDEELEELKRDANLIKKPIGRIIDFPKLKTQQRYEDTQAKIWEDLGRTLREGEESGAGV